MSARHRVWKGGEGDAAALAALHAPVFPDPWPEAAFASLLSRDEVFVLIGARKDKSAPEGFILVRSVACEAEVLTLCVAVDARRAGVGNALLSAACDEARARGADGVVLEVGESNSAAVALYQQAGFTTVGRRAAYYRHGPDAADAIVMKKVIRDAKAATGPGA